MLVAGAVQQVVRSGRYGGPSAYGGAAQEQVQNNHASNVADYDFGDEAMDEEVKFETVSHRCAMSVKAARTAAGLTQQQLAAKVNEKGGKINAVENGTANYSSDLINRIEKALNAKIDRGRKVTCCDAGRKEIRCVLD